MNLSDYRRPVQDSGIGFHYTASDAQGADLGLFQKWSAEMRAMHASWTTILNPSVDVTRHALSVGMEPIHRFYIERPGARAIEGEPLDHARLFIKEGDGRWVQDPHNEANNAGENPNGIVANPADLAKVWVPWAKAIISYGGYPSTPALSPGGTWDDLDYLRKFLAAVEGIEPDARQTIFQRGAWVAVHNYTLNHPPDYRLATKEPPEYRCSFLGYELVAKLVFEMLGFQIPVLSTEGGPVVGAADDKTLPPVDETMHADWARQIVEHMRLALRWYFGCSFWLIANYAAGFMNPAWESGAWFKADRHLLAVDVLRGMTAPERGKVWQPEVTPVTAKLYEPFLADLIEIATVSSVEPALVAAIVDAESAWNPNAYREEPSLPAVEWNGQTVPDSSLGLGQILRSTAKDWGLNSDAELYDPYKNLQLTVNILGGNLKHFGGDEHKAISAYNQGIAGVEKSGWEVNAGYVTTVLAYRDHYKAEGLDIMAIEGPVPEELQKELGVKTWKDGYTVVRGVADAWGQAFTKLEGRLTELESQLAALQQALEEAKAAAEKALAGQAE